jgi:hypothetical protein
LLRCIVPPLRFPVSTALSVALVPIRAVVLGAVVARGGPTPSVLGRIVVLDVLIAIGTRLPIVRSRALTSVGVPTSAGIGRAGP